MCLERDLKLQFRLKEQQHVKVENRTYKKNLKVIFGCPKRLGKGKNIL